jgi:pimeloyl-ACP methyl ester carboxylesterase
VLPVVAYISAAISAASPGQTLLTLRQALAEAGYVDGHKVAIEFHTAEGQYDRLPMMIAELVRRQVAVIVASPIAAALAAKDASKTVPILFGATDDPVKLRLVASFALPGGNATGVNFYLAELGLSAKRLGLAFLGFPLHPAGRPSQDRAAYLFEVQIPMLFLQGTRDALASVDQIESVCKKLGRYATLKVFKDADHSFHVPVRTGRKESQVLEDVLDAFAAWLDDVIASGGNNS